MQQEDLQEVEEMTREETSATMADMTVVEVKKESDIVDEKSENPDQSVPSQTSNHQDNDEEETDNIPSHISHLDQNSLTSDKPLSRTSKFPKLRTNLETRSKALNYAWTELNSILYEYKAELLLAENQPRKFDNVTDLDELKSQLIEKENENIQLQQQCDSFQRASEQDKMDLSIKDSLLKKYQDDLLQKETSLIHANTKICKLESRLRMLESNESGPPRKVMRTMTPGRVPHFSRRMDVSGLVKTSALMGKLLPKRHKPAPASQKQVAPTPSTQPSTSTEPPIVCIEVEDDDVITDVTQAAQAVSQEQDTMFLESYTDNSYQAENSSAGFQDDPNSGENVTDYDDSFNETGEYSGLEESGLEQSLEPSVQGALEQGWDQIQVPQYRHQQRQSGQGAPNKGNGPTCSYCNQKFCSSSVRKEHERVVHLKIKKHLCQHCGHSFGKKHDLKIHIERRHTGAKLPIRVETVDDGDGITIVNRTSQVMPDETTLIKMGDQFQCPYCERMFGRSSHVKEHVESIHVNSALYQCAYCEKKSSRRRRDIVRHIRDTHQDF